MSTDEPSHNDLSMEEQMQQMAEQATDFLSNGFEGPFDYSVKSLEQVDLALDEAFDFFPEMEEGRQEGLVSTIGAYVFEVARRNYGGKYYWYDAMQQPILVAGQPEFEVSMIAFDKVRGRVTKGQEDNIPYYFQGFIEQMEKAQPGDRVHID